ncbi:serine/arginine repetitive matrix protein 1-like [Diceros bicornis minor]|uniref:serine/arginine repetitive matrix protein 1-like n=1 Tax=Diceros bicornis minor TaxID=77932 RepID=UPI0026E9D858|nr:serine/arginine repetitive matrix protein 1-like [Diceros bicornis minor]
MEGAPRGRRPGQERPGRQGPSHGEDQGLHSTGNPSFQGKREDRHPRERRGEKGILETAEGARSSPATGITRQSQVAEGSRHKRGRSPDDPPGGRHQENGLGEEEVRRRPAPPPCRRKDQPDRPRAGRQGRGGSARSAPPLRDRRTPPRSPVRTAGPRRCDHSLEAGPASPKRLRRRSLLPPPPHARAPPAELPSRLLTHVGALEVALGELRAPGGAFLPRPARPTQPAASQRAWLGWQLAHAGATLHWALAALDALLAAQPRPACPRPSLPAAGAPAALGGAPGAGVLALPGPAPLCLGVTRTLPSQLPVPGSLAASGTLRPRAHPIGTTQTLPSGKPF